MLMYASVFSTRDRPTLSAAEIAAILGGPSTRRRERRIVALSEEALYNELTKIEPDYRSLRKYGLEAAPLLVGFTSALMSTVQGSGGIRIDLVSKISTTLSSTLPTVAAQMCAGRLPKPRADYFTDQPLSGCFYNYCATPIHRSDRNRQASSRVDKGVTTASIIKTRKALDHGGLGTKGFERT